MSGNRYRSGDRNPRDNRSHPYRRQEDGDSRYRGDERQYSRSYESTELGFDRPSRSNRDHKEDGFERRRSGYDRLPHDNFHGGRERLYGSRDYDLDNRSRRGNSCERGGYPDEFGIRSLSSQRDRLYPDEINGGNNRSSSGQRDRGYESVDYNKMDIPRREDMDYNQREAYVDGGFYGQNRRFDSGQQQGLYETMDFDRIDIPRQQDIDYHQRERSPNIRSRSPRNMDYDMGDRSGEFMNYDPRSRSPQKRDYNDRDRLRQGMDNHRNRSTQNRDHNMKGDRKKQSKRPPYLAERVRETEMKEYKGPSNESSNGSNKGQSRPNNPNTIPNIGKRNNSTSSLKKGKNPDTANQSKAVVPQSKSNINERKIRLNLGENNVPGNANQNNDSNVSSNANHNKDSSTPKTVDQTIEEKTSTDIPPDISNEQDDEIIDEDDEPDLLASKEMTTNDNRIFKNPSLDEDSKMILIFLNHAMYSGLVKGNLSHCNLLSQYYFGHRNAVKLLQYEVRKLTDATKLFKNNKKKEYTPADVKSMKKVKLIKSRDQALKVIETLFGKTSTEEQKAKREKLVNDCINKLVDPQYPEDLVPKLEDYVKNPSFKQNEDDLKQEFQWQFVVFAYQLIGFLVLDETPPPDEIANLNNLHLDNGTLAAVLVECIRLFEPKGKKVKPGDNVILTGQVAKILKHDKQILYLRDAGSAQIYTKQIENNAKYQTEILDLLPKDEDLSTTIVRDFANMVLFFDQAMTILQYKMIEYTPLISLSPDVKRELFDKMVKTVYKEGLKIWRSGVSLAARKFNWLYPLH